MKYIRRGSGKPLLLVHGLGGSHRSWNTILPALSAEREVIAIDLPGFGDTPKLSGETSIRTLADAVTAFLARENLTGIDAVGTSMGARLVLELARRGVLGAVVSLDPGGFWRGWEIPAFYNSLALSIRLVCALQPAMPLIARNATLRRLLLQFSARAWRLSPQVVLDEMRDYAAAPVFDELLHQLAFGEKQQGALRSSLKSPLVIGWGRNDLVCFPSQAKRALELFPDARLHWFANYGHFSHWDAPRETTQLILQTTK